MQIGKALDFNKVEAIRLYDGSKFYLTIETVEIKCTSENSKIEKNAL